MGTPVITIFVRHAEGCKHAADEFSKRCDCRKHLRWTANGQQYRRAANARTWADAEDVKRGIEAQLSGHVSAAPVVARTIDACVQTFLQDKATEGVAPDGISRYKRELARLRTFSEHAGVYTITGLSRELLSDYAATWETIYPSTGTRALVAKCIKCFLRFCYEAKWLDRIPALPRIKVTEPETMPLTTEEYTALLTAATAPKLRALIQLMRWSGLAIRDACTIRRDAFQRDDKGFCRVVTHRQKTGVPVSVPVPGRIATEILAVSTGEYAFWHGRGDGENFALGYGAKISDTMDRAGIPDVCTMKSHRLRDTFAVDLLAKGVPLEEVSKLLGHESIRTTEKHYAKWQKDRQDRLDALVTGTWESYPVHGEVSR